LFQTNIGDAIELRGLGDAFSQTTDDKNFCAIGSVKGNIGHANCAAGLTGFLKTVLCLEQRQLVPTAHFEAQNPKIPVVGSPFFINPGLRPWQPDGDKVKSPLRAGVSSFGIGGTNAHCVLREFTATERAAQLARGTTGRPWHLLTVSAQTKASAEAGLLKLADKLAEPDPPELCDTAYTLHVGREAYGYRAALVCGEPVAAAAGLRGLAVGERAAPNASVVFAFPGQGSQYFEMGAGLYR
jgi:acyl transferase domain-containing protein